MEMEAIFFFVVFNAVYWADEFRTRNQLSYSKSKYFIGLQFVHMYRSTGLKLVSISTAFSENDDENSLW